MLRLRPWQEEDRDFFVRLVSDPENMWRLDGPAADPAGLFARLVGSTSGPTERAWAIVPRDGESPVGHVFLTRSGTEDPWELGYVLDPSVRGCGFATAAGRLACKTVEDDLVIATVDTDHAASIRVLEKLGFVLECEEVDETGPFLRYQRPRGSMV